MTCGQKGCLENTRWPNRAECWKNGLCQIHYWDESRYLKWNQKKKCPCGCGNDE